VVAESTPEATKVVEEDTETSVVSEDGMLDVDVDDEEVEEVVVVVDRVEVHDVVAAFAINRYPAAGSIRY
jgi:hypothetical protein